MNYIRPIVSTIETYVPLFVEVVREREMGDGFYIFFEEDKPMVFIHQIDDVKGGFPALLAEFMTSYTTLNAVTRKITPVRAVVFAGSTYTGNSEASLVVEVSDFAPSRFFVQHAGRDVLKKFDALGSLSVHVEAFMKALHAQIVASKVSLPHGGMANVLLVDPDSAMITAVASVSEDMDELAQEGQLLVNAFGAAELGTYLAAAQIDRDKDAMAVGRDMMEALSEHAAPVAIIIVDPHNTEARIYSYDYRTDTVYPNIKDAHDLGQALKKAQA